MDIVDEKIMDSLKENPAHPSILAKKLSLPRTTICYRLSRLAKHKIVSMKTNGRKSLWHLSASVPLSGGSITIYRGKDIEGAYTQLLTLPKGSIIMSIQCGGAVHGEIMSLSKSFIQKAHDVFKKKQIMLKGISNESAIRHLKNLNQRLIKSHIGRSVGLKLVSNKLFMSDGEIFVTDKFALISNPAQQIAIICKDDGIINAIKDTCTMLYDLLEDTKSFDINQYFKDLSTNSKI